MIEHNCFICLFMKFYCLFPKFTSSSSCSPTLNHNCRFHKSDSGLNQIFQMVHQVTTMGLIQSNLEKQFFWAFLPPSLAVRESWEEKLKLCNRLVIKTESPVTAWVKFVISHSPPPSKIYLLRLYCGTLRLCPPQLTANSSGIRLMSNKVDIFFLCTQHLF